ncbi:MAG: alpha/beta fold hydrolase [Bacteroidetes bacterium]|nr:alpha/beta fold hydrolase [Bacteroidota bacterium]
MNNNEGFIHYDAYHLYYQRFGTGPKVLLAFHGFDGNSADFEKLQISLGIDYSIFSFDLFFHGKSYIDQSVDDPILNDTTFGDLIQFFLDKHQLKKTSLLGYSLGGKLAMGLVEVMPYKWENIFLIASDGFKQSLWNNFVASTTLGQLIFERVIRHPQIFVKVAAVMKRVKLLPHKLHSFLLLQMESPEKRKKVYDVLLLYREYRPNISRLGNICKRYQINLQVIAGKNDEIVPPQPMIEFMQGVNFGNMHLLNCAHNLLDLPNELATIVKNNLLHTVSWEMKAAQNV